MFRFFTTRKWALWGWLGSALILSTLWIQVKIDVMINEWFGEFYDMIQKALGAPNSITISEYWASLFFIYYTSWNLCCCFCCNKFFYSTFFI